MGGTLARQNKIQNEIVASDPPTRSTLKNGVKKIGCDKHVSHQFYAGGCHCFGGRACVGRCCWSCSAVDSSISKQGWTLCVVGSFVALVPLPSIYTHLVVVYLGTAKGYVKICRSISMSLRPKYHNCMISSTYNYYPQCHQHSCCRKEKSSLSVCLSVCLSCWLLFLCLNQRQQYPGTS